MQVNFVVDFVPILLTKFGFSVFWSNPQRFWRKLSPLFPKKIDSQVYLSGIVRVRFYFITKENSVMKETVLGSHLRKVPSIAVGCMRLSEKSKDEMNHFIHSALEQGAYFFDHADIYGSGMSETVFGDAFASDPSLHREDVLIQSKCGIRQGCYDLSKEHILESVDGILKRLQTDYIDLLLLHRPDALVEPEEVAAAFDVLFESGKVRHFGVSNHKPMQIALLQKYVRQPLVVNQVQFSIPVSNLVANGMEVNMETPGSVDHDGSLLDYCRLHDITLQA